MTYILSNDGFLVTLYNADSGELIKSFGGRMSVGHEIAEDWKAEIDGPLGIYTHIAAMCHGYLGEMTPSERVDAFKAAKLARQSGL